MRGSCLLVLVVLAAPAAARADIVPSPERPHDWEPRSPPTPAPPPEKELPPLALWCSALAFAAAVVLLRARPQERPRW